MEAYLTVMAHFITKDWRLEHFVLETKKMEESHTAEHISQTLKEVISDWDTEFPLSMTMQRIWLHSPISWPRTRCGNCKGSPLHGTIVY